MQKRDGAPDWKEPDHELGNLLNELATVAIGALVVALIFYAIIGG